MPMTSLERRELPHAERPRAQSERSFAKSTCIVGLLSHSFAYVEIWDDSTSRTLQRHVIAKILCNEEGPLSEYLRRPEAAPRNHLKGIYRAAPGVASEPSLQSILAMT